MRAITLIAAHQILGPMKSASPSLTKRYEPVFTRLAVVKVSLPLVTYQHVSPPSSLSLRKERGA